MAVPVALFAGVVGAAHGAAGAMHSASPGSVGAESTGKGLSCNLDLEGKLDGTLLFHARRGRNCNSDPCAGCIHA